MIPPLVDIGASWKVLPPGQHEATLSEVRQRFATNGRRLRLYAGLEAGCRDLAAAGCGTVYVDGSFVTEKPLPGDFDACWDPLGVDAARLRPVLLDFGNGRARQKQAYGGEFFPSTALADGQSNFLRYFAVDKETDLLKGLIKIRLH
jgi:hypothetical protein